MEKISKLLQKNQITIIWFRNYKCPFEMLDEIFNFKYIHNGKKELLKYINTLTLSDIYNKNKIIILNTNTTLSINENQLKNDIKLHHIYIQSASTNYNETILSINRCKYSIDDIKMLIRKNKINTIKENINTDHELIKKQNEILKVLDVDIMIHTPEAIGDIKKLLNYIIDYEKII